MGFYSDIDAKPLAPEKRAATPRKKLLEALTTERGCDVCPLKQRWGRISSPRMPCSGSKEADILVLGEAPGEAEDKQGRAFVGDNGKLLRQFIPSRFSDRVAYQNVVRCRPEDNRDPTPQEVHACSIHLEEDIARLRPKAILGIGWIPLRQFISDTAITRIHGIKFPVRLADRTMWYFPVLHPSYVLHTGGHQAESSAAYPVLRADVKKFFVEVDNWRRPTIRTFKREDVFMPSKEADTRALLDKMADPIGVDVETEALKPFKGAQVLSTAFSDLSTTVAFSVKHPEQVNDWAWPLVLETIKKRRWIAHSAGMELLWFWHSIGLDWNPGRFEDTMALGRVHDERETLLALAFQSRIHLGTNVKSLSALDVNRLREYPLSEVLPYNGFDAQACAHVFAELMPQVSPRLYDRLIGTTKSFVAMEIQGLPVNRAHSQDLYKYLENEEIKFTHAAADLYEVKEWQRRTQLEFNIASNDHVGAVLHDIVQLDLPSNVGKDGKRRFTVDEQTLEALTDHTPLIAHVLDFREVTKLKGTYVEGIATGAQVGNDGNIHPSYNSMLVATLRSSCDGPNAQNFPKRKHREIRRQIEAPYGHLFVAIDYGQLQGRLAAMASKDQKFIQHILDDYDIHSYWRDRLLSSHPEWMDRIRRKSGETTEKALQKAARDNVKQDFVFHSLFGGTARGAAERTGVPEAVMLALQEEFWDMHPGVKSWIKAKRAEYRDTGGVTLMSGLRRHAILKGNEMINNPIQNGEAEIVMAAQTELTELALTEHDPFLFPRIDVHDDLTFLLPDDDERLERYIVRITDVMLKPRFNWIIVPLLAEVSIGRNWCDMEEVAKFKGDWHK